ncbi:hypothetical protein PUMCH_000404 [Australozyma saopauloensis]|uniref:Protein IFH1 n=1 Tax=Australozyma saopauloensis TaxID=291208 RepID=A0AAX4H3Q7_9ASCO|nr:hypothetical protein PUMCH_000404 [[Candida] saopauloensis]
MAKTPRKAQPFRQKAVALAPTMASKTARPHQYGGKNFQNLKNPMSKSRRFSLAESTSSESSDGLPSQRAISQFDINSDSESSLTALSEQEESQHIGNSGKSVTKYSGSRVAAKSKPRSQNATKSRSAKSTKTVRKRVSTKTHYRDADISDDSASSDDGDEDAIDAEKFTMGLYSMMGKTEGDSSGSESSDDSQDNGNESSSSDDSEVDFVRLQAEQRLNNLKAIKGLPGKPTQSKTKALKRRRSTAIRKRSEVALPEDINFQFEFDQSKNESVFDDSDQELTTALKEPKIEEEEEDIGEEVQDLNQRPDFEFHFDEPMIDVPKIKDEELNSDDDYEFDDNDLLATLQAENDIDEFLPSENRENIRTRQSSMSSMNDDTEDPFLREEEKFLVNEFEVNGFDDEEPGRTGNETAKVMDSFNMTGTRDDQVIQYASSSEDESGSEFDDLKLSYDDNDNEIDDYIDFIDIDTPATSSDHKKEEKILPGIGKGTAKKEEKSKFPKKRGSRRGPLDSEEEDDSYLWNYFFSSDAESDAEAKDLDDYDVEEQLLLEEVFRKEFEEKQKQLGRDEVSLENQDNKLDAGYDSGESTDVDLSLPSSGRGSTLGSKLAKEVLSSRTADYRPPVLGTWVAIDSKPFSIIDGLSTRTLTNQSNQRNPRTKNWKSFSLKNDSEDLAIELEELLNVSELDNDDENDVRIWRDFNNNKKHVPLGAFRNKSKMHQGHLPEALSGYNVSKINSGVSGRRSLQIRAKLAAQRELESQANANLAKDLNMSSKLIRRRASIADAVSEGYRPTKSGLFSENVLADVEEVMGDDRDFMALIKGL